VARRFVLALLLTLGAGPAAAQAPADLKTAIDRLGAFEYATRMNAARTIRRVPAAQAVPALAQAARSHTDQFVRYRALVLITAFNDRGTPDLMRSLLPDRNDRVREVAYRWFARRPEPAMAPTLITALQTEQAEFVRPALVSALAALGSDPAVQRALVMEVGRGLDFFRIAVIEAVGEHRGTYAANAVAEASKLDGPLQDDAVLALARMGDARATQVVAAGAAAPPDVAASMHAARCILGQDCAAQIKALVEMASNPRATPAAARAAITSLGIVAARPDTAATNELYTLTQTLRAGLREEAGLAFAVLAVRAPDHVLAWLDAAGDATHDAVIMLLRNGFERLEEDFAEEQFFAAARAAYWANADGSRARTRIAGLIDKLEF
jgi:hypothetical protein